MFYLYALDSFIFTIHKTEGCLRVTFTRKSEKMEKVGRVLDVQMQFVRIFDESSASSSDFGGFLEGAARTGAASSNAISQHLRRIAGDTACAARCAREETRESGKVRIRAGWKSYPTWAEASAG
jgi:hypothetical protein